MSVPTDSNLNGRWQEKFQKYQKLAAEMRKQLRGYRIKVVPIIIGALGTVDTLPEALRSIPKLSKGAVEVIRAMQRSVLCSAVRISWRHHICCGIGAWAISSPVPVLACRPLESSGILRPIMMVNIDPTCTCLLLLEVGKAEASGYKPKEVKT